MSLTDGQIFVDFQHMENGAADLDAQTAAIENMINSLIMELNELSKTWEGEDRNAYEQRKNAWLEGVANLKKAVTDNSGLLRRLGDNYQRHEGSVASMWNDVKY